MRNLNIRYANTTVLMTDTEKKTKRNTTQGNKGKQEEKTRAYSADIRLSKL